MPDSQIKFGFKAGMLYASAAGVVFSRKHFIYIVLAPLVVITVLIVIYALISQHFVSAYWALALHTTGCVGDVYYVIQLCKHKEVSHVKDTNVGAEFLCK